MTCNRYQLRIPHNFLFSSFKFFTILYFHSQLRFHTSPKGKGKTRSFLLQKKTKKIIQEKSKQKQNKRKHHK